MPNRTPVQWNKLLKSGNRIFVGSNAAVPNALIDNLIENSKGLHDIEVVHMLTMGENVWAKKEHSDLFKVNAFFLGPGTREAVAEGYADYTPCFLSEIPKLFQDGILPVDAALVSVGQSTRSTRLLLVRGRGRRGFRGLPCGGQGDRADQFADARH